VVKDEADGVFFGEKVGGVGISSNSCEVEGLKIIASGYTNPASKDGSKYCSSAVLRDGTAERSLLSLAALKGR
jgi:hypothetical protein